MKAKSITSFALLVMMAVGLMATPASAQNIQQTEKEFEQLMPISGTVKTFFGDFELDHAFPTADTSERIYDLMDYSRAAQLYLWSLPITSMTQILESFEANYPGYEDNTLVSIRTFNERRGILTVNETTDYFFVFGNTKDKATILEVPPGVIIGMMNSMWQESPADIGAFGANAGTGGKHILVGPNTPADDIPEPSAWNDDFTVHHISTNQFFILFRIIGTKEEANQLASKIRLYNYGEEPTIKIIDGEDKFIRNTQPRGIKYWELLHKAINQEVVQERDRFFMYWLKTLGIEKGKPFNPTARQRKILEDGAKMGELMAKTLVYDERLEGVLRQNDWRYILGGEWGDAMKNTQRMQYYDIFDPRARYTYEATTVSPAMTRPRPGKAQGYIGKFETEEGERLKGENNYVIRVEDNVPADLFWSIVIYDTDHRSLIDNRAGTAGGKATVGSKTPGLRQNADGSYYVFLGPEAPPEGWEANYVQTIPGRGWFPYMRAYGATQEFFDDSYQLPTITKVKDFSQYIR